MIQPKKTQPRSRDISFFFILCEGESERDEILWERGLR